MPTASLYVGHISNKDDYIEISKDTASNIPGSSYHNRLISFNGIQGSPGNHDMQLMTSPEPEFASLTVIKKVINDNIKPSNKNIDYPPLVFSDDD